MGKPDIGPRYFAIGNPTVAAGAGMLDGGLSRKITIKPTHRKKNAVDAFGNPKHTGNMYLGSSFDVTIEVPRSVATAVEQFESAYVSGKFRAPGSSVPQRSLAVVHPDFLAGAAAAASTTWFHSVDDVEIGDLDYNTDEGDAEEEYVALTFRAGYVDETQATPTPVAIPLDLQPKARGNTTGMTALGYTLPTRYAA